MKTICKLHVVEVDPKTGNLCCAGCNAELSQKEAMTILKAIVDDRSTAEHMLSTLNLTGKHIRASTKKEREDIEKQERALSKKFLQGGKKI